MQRTNIVELKPSKKQEKILKECMLLSSCVYNMTNYEVRQSFFNKEKVPSFFTLQQKLQAKDDYQLLGRSYSLPRIQIYAETNSARFKLISSKTQKKVGLPKYLKNRKTNTTLPSYLVIDGCQYSLNRTKATIPLSRAMRKKYNLKNFRIPFNGILRWKGKQARGQIHFKNGKYHLYQSVYVEDTKPRIAKNVAGLDLGIKYLFACDTSEGRDKLIGSKRFYKQWLYLSNLIFKEQESLATINRRSSRRLQKLFNNRSKYQNNLFNNITAKLFKFLKRQDVGTLVIGDIKNIREENDWGSKGNKMLHNYWAFDKLLHKVENLAESTGIKIVMTTEEYTSSTCPICQDSHKNHKKDRIFICSFCGYVAHRDIVGARNIMVKGMHDLQEQSVHQCETALLGVA